MSCSLKRTRTAAKLQTNRAHAEPLRTGMHESEAVSGSEPLGSKPLKMAVYDFTFK
jgi:hypothetical protein